MIYAASREDLPELVKMALEIPKDLPFENFPKPSVEKVAEFVYTQWTQTPILVYKDEKTKEILGMIGLMVDEPWWSGTKVLTDYMFFVKPEHRNYKITKELMNGARDLARINGIPMISHMISENRTESKLRMFEKSGFRQSGIICTFGI